MNVIFILVYALLTWISSVTGLTYHEINIVAYYFVLPALLLFLVDKIIQKRYLCSITFLAAWLLLLLFTPNFSDFSDRAFTASMDFLKSFSVIGINYVTASVLICVILPAVAFVLLLRRAFPARFSRRARG